jgi:flagellar basal body-associated protein FliL
MAKSKDAAKDGQQEGKNAEPKKKGEGGGSKAFVMMFSVAMIVQLVIIVILVYFVLSKSNNAPQSAAQPAVAEKSAESAKGGEEEKEGEKKAEEGPIFIYQTEDLIVNPKGSGGRRYLMTQIGLSVPSEVDKKEFEESRKAQINDILTQFLANRSIDELADIDKRDSLKIELRKTLNKEIAGKKIKNVFFSKFVVQ